MDAALDEVLEHHGIKGMKWGVRKRSTPAGPATVNLHSNEHGQIKKTSGGERHPTHADAKTAMTLHQVARASGSHALSNDELKTLVDRMNLESNYSRLDAGKQTKGKKFTNDVMDTAGKEVTRELGKTVASTFLSQIIGAKLKKG